MGIPERWKGYIPVPADIAEKIRSALPPLFEREKELDTIVVELSRYKDVTESQLASSLSLRWTVERGLIAAANMVFDIASSMKIRAWVAAHWESRIARARSWSNKASSGGNLEAV